MPLLNLRPIDEIFTGDIYRKQIVLYTGNKYAGDKFLNIVKVLFIEVFSVHTAAILQLFSLSVCRHDD